MSRKKMIEAYFLQKTGGTYTEQSLHFLLDLLHREGLASESTSVEQVAASLATLVRDGAHLHIATKRLPEHIRAQIDFSLQKTKKAKSNSRRAQQSTFDDLLASLDSDDPRFTMDTTLGLGFTSLDELESDLKKRALDSISPVMFRKSAASSMRDAEMQEQEYADAAEAAAAADAHNHRHHNNHNIRSPLSQHGSHSAGSSAEFGPANQDNDTNSADSADISSDISSGMSSAGSTSATISSGIDVMRDMREIRDLSRDINQERRMLRGEQNVAPQTAAPQNIFPQFPDGSFGAGPVGSPQSLHSPVYSQSAQAAQAFSDLQMRAALTDAKERLLTQRIGSLQDPVLLRALSFLDERMMQLRMQSSAASAQAQFPSQLQQSQQSLQSQSPFQFPPHISAQSPLYSGSSSSHSAADSTELGSAFRFSAKEMTQATHSAVTQLRAQIADIVSLQKSMQQLTQFNQFSSPSSGSSFGSNGNLGGSPNSDYLAHAAAHAANSAQSRHPSADSKTEVKRLRTHVTSLQEQIGALTSQIQNLVAIHAQQQQAQQYPQQLYSTKSSRSAMRPLGATVRLPGRVKQMRASAIHVTDMPQNLQQSKQGQSVQSTALVPTPDAFPPESFDESVAHLQSFSVEDEPTLQKMYALLAVGMRELPVAPNRAKHIYEQLQRLYTTLSGDEKAVIYPSVVEFYASLSHRIGTESARGRNGGGKNMFGEGTGDTQ